MMERQIRQLIVDVSVKDHHVGLSFSQLEAEKTQINCVEEIKKKPRSDDMHGHDIFVAPADRLFRTANAFISSEGLMTDELPEAAEDHDVVPKRAYRRTQTQLAQTGFESANLRALSGTVNSRKANDFESAVASHVFIAPGGTENFSEHLVACWEWPE